MLRYGAPFVLAFFARVSAWDSRNVSEAEWACNGPAVGLQVAFGDLAVICSTEVLQDASQLQPVITYYNASADPATLYTVIIVDRDAPSASNPVRSPLRHYAAASIPSTVLAAGAGPSVTALFNYSGPQPPVGSLCHRYYVMLYSQAAGVVPILADPTVRTLWDFPAWAANFSLTKIAVNYWETQNLSARTAPCSGGGGGGSSSSALSAGAIAGIAVAAACALAAAGVAAWALRARALRRRWKGGGIEDWEAEASDHASGGPGANYRAVAGQS